MNRAKVGATGTPTLPTRKPPPPAMWSDSTPSLQLFGHAYVSGIADTLNLLCLPKRGNEVSESTAMTRPTWDEWALGIARAVSTRADCSRRRVGAVVLDAAHRVVATGYNGTAAGREGCLDGACPRARAFATPYSPYDNCIANHAEVNALLYADRSKIEGGTMYITDAPCFGCTKVLANSGLARAVWPTGETTTFEVEVNARPE